MNNSLDCFYNRVVFHGRLHSMWMCHSVFDEHLGYFQFGVIMDQTAVSLHGMFLGRPKFSFLWDKWPEMGLLGCMDIVLFLMKFSNYFPGWLYLLHDILPAISEWWDFLTSSLTLMLSLFPKTHLIKAVIAHCGFKLLFPNGQRWWISFVCLCVYLLSVHPLWWNACSMSLSNF